MTNSAPTPAFGPEFGVPSAAFGPPSFLLRGNGAVPRIRSPKSGCLYQPHPIGNLAMLEVRQITALHRNCVQLWHSQPIENPHRDLLYVVCEQHKYNFLLWHEEDMARSPTATDREIAQVKRNIDQLNQKRNDSIERIDDTLRRMIDERRIVPANGAKWNTETPGAAIDRLSILALRIYHMEEQAERADASPEHVRKAQERLSVLATQHEDLSAALAELLADLFSGRKRLKLYRQMKMYNDPTLNPYLYSAESLRKAG
jgi:hypothetical protein